MKIALIGYGKMGHMIENIARQRGHEIVCIIDINNMDDIESDAFRSADVAIEFTNPTAAYGNYLRAWKQGVKVVSGSTGWLKDHEADVRKACTEEGHTLFWASNFSLGVAIFSAVNKYLARIMNAYPTYDVSEVETHHIHKLDAPSGTAITLAEQVCAELDRKDDWVKGEVHNADGTITGSKDQPENRCHTRGRGAGHTHPDLRLACRHDTDNPFGTQPQRLCPWCRAGSRIYGHTRGTSHYRRFVQVLTTR